MPWMLDTDICIYLINRKVGHEVVLRHMDGKLHGEILISAITFAELQFGIANSAQRKGNEEKVSTFVRLFEILDFDRSAASVYGNVRAKLTNAGKLIAPLDMLIAAHAIASSSTLVTNNVAEFSRIRNLKVENWTVD